MRGAVDRILFVQHGDYEEAYRRLTAGGDETYRDQRFSVQFVAELAKSAAVCTVCLRHESCWVELSQNLYTFAMSKDELKPASISKLFDDFEPSHLILRTPHIGFLEEAASRRIPTLPLFADIFQRDGIKSFYRNWRLKRALQKSGVKCIANHNKNASESLVSVLKLPADRVVPWDWSKISVTRDAKDSVSDRYQPSAFYAGSLTEDKGVGDSIRALGQLHKKGIKMTMVFAGPGDPNAYEAEAHQLGVDQYCKFLGVVPNEQVQQEMARSDFVLVPSRHTYPEGLPNTIYEALASRSVLVMSDHPSFVRRLEPDSECLIFQAGNSLDLSNCLARAIEDLDLYRTISHSSERALGKLYFGVDWSKLILEFLEDPRDKKHWVVTYSLASLRSS